MKQATTRGRALNLRMLTMLCAFAALSFQPVGSPAAAPIAVAVADFDYFDTSGEVVDQSVEHLGPAWRRLQNCCAIILRRRAIIAW